MQLTSEELVLLVLFLGILWLLSINTDMMLELNRTKQANYQNQIMAILNNYRKNAVIFHSGSCSCNNWKLVTPDPAPAETLTLLPESTPVLRFVYTSGRDRGSQYFFVPRQTFNQGQIKTVGSDLRGRGSQ